MASSYRAPVADTLFVLNDVLGFGRFSNLPGFGDTPPDVLAAVLGEAARLAEEIVLPTNRAGDLQGCRREADGSVQTPDGFRAAFGAYREGGWMGLAVPSEWGGQGLPYSLHQAASEYMIGANMALMMYAGLTQGAIAAIAAHGTDEQKTRFLPKLASGEWTGTMNLTEPQAGTDLGLLRTKAERAGDGSFRVTGDKIFISAGEHDLTDNIVHLVLARVSNAPAGSKGLSLFIVPKVLEDGTRNALRCEALEAKMGIHGNATCAMRYEGATGWLLGPENEGLKAMFTMMNEARLGVALQGLAVGEAAYQAAAAYARERLQGRALGAAKGAVREADPIIVHPDVRRTLMSARAWTEGARALMLWTSLQADLARVAQDASERDEAADLLGLLTPVVKAVLTDKGFEHAVAAQGVLGGHGYIESWGLSQFVRDARIAMIYEGTNGVQAMDLIGRKLPANGGRAARLFFGRVAEFCAGARSDERLAPLARALQAALDDLQAATVWLMENAMAKPENAGAAATDYLNLFGLVATGYMWGLQAKAADGDEPFAQAKRATARFFAERILPETGLRLARVRAGADATMALDADAF